MSSVVFLIQEKVYYSFHCIAAWCFNWMNPCAYEYDWFITSEFGNFSIAKSKKLVTFDCLNSIFAFM